MSSEEAAPVRRKAAIAGAVVVGGVVIPGLLSRALHEAGLAALGTAVFATGFVGMVVVVWYLWLRPLEITGPIE